jgi:hypothetical protein
MKTRHILSLITMTLFLSACAGSANLQDPEVITRDPSGFFFGLWNGFTFGFSLIGSIFSDNISIYDVNNTGFGYDLGFLLGAGFFGGGASTVMEK